jgi:hypothetical protein
MTEYNLEKDKKLLTTALHNSCRLELLLLYRRLSVSFKKGFEVIYSQSQASSGFSDSSPKSLSVGMLGIEPRLPHPQRGVLPLYDIPFCKTE